MTSRKPLDRYEYALGKAVEALLKRVAQHERMELTHEEMLDFMVPSQYHEHLKALAGIARLDRYYNTYDVPVPRLGSEQPGYTLQMVVHPTNDRPAPPYINDRHLCPRHDSEVGLRLAAWADRRIELGLEFARVKWLISQLNETCKSVAQVKYYWPSISTLCSVGNNSLLSLADALGAAGKPVSPPPLPMPVRKACQAAAGTVTAAALLDAVDIPDMREVAVDIVIPYDMLVHDHVTGMRIRPE